MGGALLRRRVASAGPHFLFPVDVVEHCVSLLLLFLPQLVRLVPDEHEGQTDEEGRDACSDVCKPPAESEEVGLGGVDPDQIAEAVAKVDAPVEDAGGGAAEVARVQVWGNIWLNLWTLELYNLVILGLVCINIGSILDCSGIRLDLSAIGPIAFGSILIMPHELTLFGTW